MSVLKRLSVLQNEAQLTPVPTRKYFHIGQPEIMDDVGECIPMLSWVDDNLSRYVVSDAASTFARHMQSEFKRPLGNEMPVAGHDYTLASG